MSRPGSVEREPSQCPIDPEGEKFQTLVELVLAKYSFSEQIDDFITNRAFFLDRQTSQNLGRFYYHFTGLYVLAEFFENPPVLILPGRGRKVRKKALPDEAHCLDVDFIPLDRVDFHPGDLTLVLASAYVSWKVFFHRLDQFLAEQLFPPNPTLYFSGTTNARMAKFAQRFGFQEGTITDSPVYEDYDSEQVFPLAQWKRQCRRGAMDSFDLDGLETNIYAEQSTIRQAIAACEGPLVDQLIRRLSVR